MTESLEGLTFAEGFIPGTLPGAVPAEGFYAGSDAHYGSPLREQRALSSGRAFTVMGHRTALRITGADRLSWLHSLMSQDMTTLQAGESRRGLFLDAQGRIEFEVDITASIDSVYFFAHREQATALAAFLTRMKFMLRVDVEDLSTSHILIGASDPELLGDDARESLKLDAVVVFRDPWLSEAPGGYSYTTADGQEQRESSDYRWFEALIPREKADDVLRALAASGMSAAGTLAVDALRIAALKPLHGQDTDEKSLPHELDLLRNSVHLAKGCYKGQETVARVHNLGHPPRRLVFLHIDGSSHTLPAPGSEIFLEGREDARPVGRVTSAALHVEAGPIGLGVIKRSADTEAALTIIDGEDRYPAAQVTVVAADAGSVVGRPQGLSRLSPRQS